MEHGPKTIRMCFNGSLDLSLRVECQFDLPVVDLKHVDPGEPLLGSDSCASASVAFAAKFCLALYTSQFASRTKAARTITLMFILRSACFGLEC